MPLIPGKPRLPLDKGFELGHVHIQEVPDICDMGELAVIVSSAVNLCQELHAQVFGSSGTPFLGIDINSREVGGTCS
jgi:hypothetical protein